MFIDMEARVGPFLTTFLEFDLMTISATKEEGSYAHSNCENGGSSQENAIHVPSRYSPPPASSSNGHLYDKALRDAGTCRVLHTANPASTNNRPLGLENELNDVPDSALNAASSVVCVAKGRTYGKDTILRVPPALNPSQVSPASPGTILLHQDIAIACCRIKL